VVARQDEISNNKSCDCQEIFRTEFLTILRNDMSVSVLGRIFWCDGSPLIYEIQCLRFVRTTYHSTTQNFAHTLHVLFSVIRIKHGFCLPKQHKLFAIYHAQTVLSIPVFLNRRNATRYGALASILRGRERPEEATVCYKTSLVKLITNLNVILYLSTCHTVYVSVLILFMIMT
jgi:hypothetical protein